MPTLQKINLRLCKLKNYSYGPLFAVQKTYQEGLIFMATLVFIKIKLFTTIIIKSAAQKKQFTQFLRIIYMTESRLQNCG